MLFITSCPQNKVTSVTFLCGKAIEDLCRIKQVCLFRWDCQSIIISVPAETKSDQIVTMSPQVDLDSRHMGWVTSELPGGDHHVIKVELKGPENTLRVRQVKVLGWKEGDSIKIPGQISASMAQQKNCEGETLRVFRLITSQVSMCFVLLPQLRLEASRLSCFQSDVTLNDKSPVQCNETHCVVSGLWKTNLWGCRADPRAGGEKPAVIT